MAAEFSSGVLLKGLPFNVTEKEIKLFFKSLDIPDEHIHLIKFRTGKGTGLCFVKLSDDEQLKRALLMDKNHIGERYVEVEGADQDTLYHLQLAARSGEVNARDLYKICNEGNRKKGFRDRSPIRQVLPTKYGYVSGVPKGHHYKEVRLFFGGILIGRNCIHLVRESDSSVFRGDAYIQFGTVEECRKGLALSGKKLGGSTITVEPCTKEEYEAHVWGGDERSVHHRSDDWESEHREYRSSGRGKKTPSPVRRRREAYKARYDQEQNEYYTASYCAREDRYRDTIAMHAYGGEASFFSTPPESLHDHRPAEAYAVDQHQYSRSLHGHQPPLDLHDDYRPSSSYNISPRQHIYHHESPASKDDGRYSSLYGNSTSSGAAVLEPSLGTTSFSQDLYQQPSPQAVLPPERRVVRVEGLPYDVAVHEIVAFFQNYNVGFEQVRIQCRDDGSPSGKAFVNFPSEKMAHTAIEGCNRRYIGKRFVELFLV